MRNPQGTNLGLVLALSFTETSVAQPVTSSPPSSLVDIPVADMTTVTPAAYKAATALAAGGGSPLEVVLTITGPFEGVAQHILQVNEGAETPTSTRITVVRDGLLDDAVRGERWDILHLGHGTSARSVGLGAADAEGIGRALRQPYAPDRQRAARQEGRHNRGRNPARAIGRRKRFASLTENLEDRRRLVEFYQSSRKRRLLPGELLVCLCCW